VHLDHAAKDALLDENRAHLRETIIGGSHVGSVCQPLDRATSYSAFFGGASGMTRSTW